MVCSGSACGFLRVCFAVALARSVFNAFRVGLGIILGWVQALFGFSEGLVWGFLGMYLLASSVC